MAGGSIGNVGFQAYGKTAGVGVNYEDMLSKIILLDPDQTPGLRDTPRVGASSPEFEWDEDTLPVALSTGVVEGADWNGDTGTIPSRKHNVQQIFRLDIAISRSQMKVRSAGGSMWDHTKMKAMKAVAIAMEKALWSQNVYSNPAGLNSVRVANSFEKMLAAANVIAATAYTKGVVGDATHSGIPNSADFNAGLKVAVDATGSGEWTAFCNSSIKQQISAFGLWPITSSTIPGQQRVINQQDNETLKYQVDFIKTDFGTVAIVYDPFVPQAANTSQALGAGNTDMTGRCMLVKAGYLKVAMLDDVHYEDVGKRGDSYAGLVVGECTFAATSSKAHVAFTGWNNYSPYSN